MDKVKLSLTGQKPLHIDHVIDVSETGSFLKIVSKDPEIGTTIHMIPIQSVASVAWFKAKRPTRVEDVRQ